MKIVYGALLLGLTLHGDTTRVTFPNGKSLIVRSDSSTTVTSKTRGCKIERLEDNSEIVTMPDNWATLTALECEPQ